MKKIVSFMLALLAVASMNLSAFALETEAGEANPVKEEIIADEIAKENKAGLSLAADVESSLSLSGLLAPNQTLRFPIQLTDENGSTVALSDEHLEEARLRVETKDGRSAVRSIKVVEDGSGYALEVKTLSGYPSKQTAYEGQLKLIKKTSGEVLHAIDLAFSVGYESVSDEAVNAAKEGAYLFVDGSTPVITDKQFNAIDKVANGEKVVLTNGEWTYEVRVSEQDSVNMLNNKKPIKEIISQFDDQNFKFLSFPAGPAFDFTGTLTIDISDVADDFENIYVYSYYNGKLNKVYATVDLDEETVSFKTKYFGRFVITDKEIKNGTVVENCVDEDCEEIVNPSKPAKPNPETGIGDLPVKLAAVMASLSVSILGLFGIRKDEK